MANAAGLDPDPHVAGRRLNNRQGGELQLAGAHGLHRTIGGLGLGHVRLLAFGRLQPSHGKPGAVRSKTPPIETRRPRLGLHVRASIGRNDRGPAAMAEPELGDPVPAFAQDDRNVKFCSPGARRSWYVGATLPWAPCARLGRSWPWPWPV